MRETCRNLELFWTLLRKELKTKYKSTVLGYLWSLLSPLAQTAIFFVVFSLFLRFNIPDYFLYLSIGFLVWQFFSNVLMQSAGILLANAHLIRKTCAPRMIFPLTSAGAELIHLIVAVPLLYALMLLCGRTPSFSGVWLLPAALCGTAMFALGLGLIIAIVNVYFRDLERILQILLQCWFYASPVFYSESQIPERYRMLLQLNPMTFFLAVWRNLFYDPAGIPWWSLLISLIYGGAVLFAGIRFFQFFQGKIAEDL